MSFPGATVELRILSGPHLGAAAWLGLGRHVFGSDDSCDFVFTDATVAPRHLALTVSGDDDQISVAAQPLEAEVALMGRLLAGEGEAIEPGVPLGLGFTALAFRPVGETWAPVTLTPLEYLPQPVSAGPRDDGGDDKKEIDKSGAKKKEFDDSGLEPSEAKASEETDGDHEEWAEAPIAGAKRRPFKLWVGLAVLFLLMATMFYGLWSSNGEGLDKATQIRAILATNNFQDLIVDASGEAVTISGNLADDREVARLVDLVRGQPAKVYLRVSVTNDRIRAVKDALNAHGFYPEVSLGEAGLTVAAYMKDSLVEAKAFGYVGNDVRDAVAERRVVYQERLAEALLAETRRAGLPELPVTFADGHLDFPVELNIEARRSLERAVSNVSRRLGVPVSYRIVSPDGLASPSLPGPLEQPWPEEAPKTPTETSPLGGLKVTGVTLSPLKFVSASDGQKLFEGSVLPSGYAIEEINNGEIILSRGDQRITHKLGE
jgi:type III secretion protein D